MKRIFLTLALLAALTASAVQLWVSPDGRHLPILPLALHQDGGVLYPAPQSAFEAAGWHLETAEEAAAREAEEAAARQAMPREISKLDLLLVLREMDKMDAFFAWLDAAGLHELWDAAQALTSDHPLYESALASVQEALGVSDEERDAILERIAK